MSALPDVAELARLEQASAPVLLEWALGEFGSSLAIATAFQAEGMVILDIAARISPAVRVFALDTGRLPEETYRMIETVRERYGVTVETVAPDTAEIEAMVGLHGPNLFYREVALRNLCCEVRKVRPLERKLRELKAWVAGLRRGQNESRADVRKIEEFEGKLKFSPLADWTAADVSEYIRKHDVPVHPLYAGLPEYWLRSLHARGGARRRRTRGPLVVGAGWQQGVRDPFLGRRKSGTEARCAVERSS